MTVKKITGEIKPKIVHIVVMNKSIIAITACYIFMFICFLNQSLHAHEHELETSDNSITKYSYCASFSYLMGKGFDRATVNKSEDFLYSSALVFGDPSIMPSYIKNTGPAILDKLAQIKNQISKSSDTVRKLKKIIANESIENKISDESKLWISDQIDIWAEVSTDTFAHLYKKLEDSLPSHWKKFSDFDLDESVYTEVREKYLNIHFPANKRFNSNFLDHGSQGVKLKTSMQSRYGGYIQYDYDRTGRHDHFLYNAFMFD